MRDSLKDKSEKLDAKFKQREDQVEAAKKQKDHEIMLKKEVRMLKEQDFKQLAERQQRKQNMKKLYLLEKDFESAEQVDKMKQERHKMVQESLERKRWQSVEKQ